MTPFEVFVKEMTDICSKTAQDKGYIDIANQEEYNNPLFHFVDTEFTGHVLGEIVYKAIRYKARRDPKDLVKIAAWAMLKYLEDGHHKATKET